MSVTLIRQSSVGLRSLRIGPAGLACAAVLALSVLAAAVTGGYLLAVKWHPNGVVRENTVNGWQRELQSQKVAVEKVKRESQDQMQALAARIARLQADMTRLDAVGLRVTELVGIDQKEFGFGQPVAVGGPESKIKGAVETSPMEFMAELDAMNSQLETKGRQLEVLESLLLDKHMGTEKLISGQPVKKAFITSYFGYRTDPFEGNSAWHNGIDFSAPEGTDIMATAAGVVSYAADKDGYGNMVEINHGDGLVTRYGHTKVMLVRVGDLVRKGQIIARVGMTGRTTAPHVHYEVVRDGLYLNPAKYLGTDKG